VVLYQGPAVFVPGQDPPRLSGKVVSTSTVNDRERQRSAVTQEGMPTTLLDLTDLNMEDFENDWPFPKDIEDSSKAIAPVKSPLPPVINCPEEPVINMPAVVNRSEQLGPVVEPPRPRNEKNSKKTLQLVPRDEEFDLSVSSQMGKREFAGFTKFARDTRPQSKYENLPWFLGGHSIAPETTSANAASASP